MSHLVLFVATFAAHLPATAATSRPQDPPPRAIPATTPAAVHLVGVEHAPGQLLGERLSPGHVRLALEAIAPDAVGVESDEAWFARGDHYRETWEAFGVAVPWAKARGLPAYGIDWVGDEDAGFASERERLARLDVERRAAAAATVDPRSYSYGPFTADQLRVVPQRAATDFALLNGEDFAARQNAWLDAERDKPGTAQHYIARRNAHIADRIAAAARKHPGGRLAVVIGAAHLGDLQRLLPARGVPVAALPASVLAARGAVADARLAPEDLVAILAWTLDVGYSPAAERRDRLEARLAEAAADEKTPEDLRVVARYLAARRRQLAGDLGGAAAAFSALARDGAEVRFPYRGGAWRLFLTVGQAARLEAGRIADVRGDRAAAVAAYEALLATLPEPAFDPRYHADDEFTARARNAVRALVATPFVPAMAFAERRQPPAAAAAPAAAPSAQADRVAKLWDAHRGKRWQELRDACAKVDRTTLAAFEALELDYHAAAAAVHLGDRASASSALDALATRLPELGAGHWLARELPALREALGRAK